MEKHSSQLDGSKGFGGRFGVEKDRLDKSAHSWQKETTSEEEKEKPKIEAKGGDAKSLRARFENLAKADESESRKRLDAERAKRLEREKLESEQARQAEADRQAKLKEDSSLEMGQKEEAEEKIVHRGGRRDSSSSDEDDDEAEEVPSSPVKSPHAFGRGIGVSVFPVLEQQQKSSGPAAMGVKVAEVPEEELTAAATTVQQTPPSPPAAAVSALATAMTSAIPVQKESEKDEEEENAWKDEPEEKEIEAHQQQQQTQQQTQQQQSPTPELTSNNSTAEVEVSPSTEGQGQAGQSAIALYDYEAAESDEISFDPDDIITEIEQVDSGWWRGRNRAGQVGLFPANYVKLL